MNTNYLKPKKAKKAGFSLMEMLVVVAIIGIFGGIVIPNIGDINDGAKDAAARSTGDVITVVLNAAATCGYQFNSSDGWTAATTGAEIIQKAETGAVIPASVGGTFVGKNFSSGTIEADEKARIVNKFSYDPVNNRILFAPW